MKPDQTRKTEKKFFFGYMRVCDITRRKESKDMMTQIQGSGRP